MSLVHTFLNSLFGQFIIGGLTVAGITSFSNQLHNPLLAGIVASVPIGMPSAVFVNDKELPSYSWNLLIMTSGLYLATFVFWFMFNHLKFDKYQSVSVAMSIWAGFGVIYYFFMKWVKSKK